VWKTSQEAVTIPGIPVGYIDLAKNPAQRGNSSLVATLIVRVSDLVLNRELLLDAGLIQVILKQMVKHSVGCRSDHKYASGAEWILVSTKASTWELDVI
jgi:hypothetical protein